jgi:hypothetical protein
MGTETQVSITRQDPAIEAYRLGLLKDTQGYIKQEIEKGTLPPDFQIANLSPEQQQAISMASQGVGAYQPYLQAGTQTLGQGIGATGAGIDTLGNALQTTGAGQGFINQAAQQAAATRDTPYAYQAAANQGLGQATQLGTGLGLEGIQSIQQGTQTGQQLGAAALQDISSLGGNAQDVAGAGSQNILNAASSAVPSTQYAQGQLANLGAQVLPHLQARSKLAHKLARAGTTTNLGRRQTRALGRATSPSQRLQHKAHYSKQRSSWNSTSCGNARALGQTAQSQFDTLGAGAQNIATQLLPQAQAPQLSATQGALQQATTGQAGTAQAAANARALGQTAQSQFDTLGAGAQNIATQTAAGAQALQAPLNTQLGSATQGAIKQAGLGQEGSQAAADNARAASAAAQQQLGQAGTVWSKHRTARNCGVGRIRGTV